MWCVPKLDRECLARMEAVLEVLSQPADERAPAPGKLARCNHEYARCGTANVFCIVEPRPGRHHTHATPNRKAAQFAKALRRIARRHPAAKTIPTAPSR